MSVGAERMTIDGLVERNGLYYKKFSNIPFTGQISGEQVGQLKKGKKHGEWTNYYEDGQLNKLANFDNGIADGVWETYYKNGQVKSKQILKDGLVTGTLKEFHENGQLSYSAEYNQRGKKHGAVIGYYDSGQLRFIGTHENGEMSGEWKRFDENWRLESIRQWKYNTFHGPSIEYDRLMGSQLEYKYEFAKGNYYCGLRTGKWKHYDGAGKFLWEYDHGEIKHPNEKNRSEYGKF